MSSSKSKFNSVLQLGADVVDRFADKAIYTSSHFNKFNIAQTLDLDINRTQFPSQVLSWGQASLELLEAHAYYGFVVEGTAVLTTKQGAFRVSEGMFFSVSAPASLDGGRGVVYARKNFSCHLYIGGRRPTKGQLKYIDGANTSVLIHPELRGHPVLNSLHLPKHTYQTMHVHPDIRVGLVYQGSGTCFIPNSNGDIGRAEIGIPLEQGDLFYIPTDGKHRFVTEDDSLSLVPWHAYTDAGVHDDSHYTLDRSVVAPNANGNETWLGEDAVFGRFLRDLK